MLIKTVAIYNRISRDNNESEDVLLNHRTITTRLCELKTYKYKLYEEIESGGKFEERKVLLQLLKDIAQGLYDGLVVVELSRIARDNLYSQMIAKVLEENDVPIITPSRIFNLNDESDRFMFDVESMISSKELKTIIRRMKNGKIEGVRRGQWVQGVPPVGYKRGDDKKLVIVESEANLVRQIFNYAENGNGIPTIVRKLTGQKTRTGKAFTLTSINTILKNETYTGRIIYNVKDKKGKTTETIISKNAHEAIISKEQFNTVQQAVRGRVSGDLEVRNRSRGNVISILKDLVYCMECGSKMGMKKDSKQANTIYLKACKCGNRGIVENKLLEQFLTDFEFLERFYRDEWQKALETPTVDSKDNLVQAIKEIEKTQGKLKKRLAGFIEMRADGDLTREQFHDKKTSTEAELQRLSEAIDDLQEKLQSLDKEALSNQYEAKLERIMQFHTTYHSGELEECNRLLKLIINKVKYVRVNERIEVTSPLEGYYEVEQGDFVDLSIYPKDIL